VAVVRLAPGVVVRPPNLPTPPPISLLTQPGVRQEGDRDLISGRAGGWEAGGGVEWYDPLRDFETARTWQEWPDETAGGSSGGAKSTRGVDPLGPGNRSPVQFPVQALIEIDEGVLTLFQLDNPPEGPPLRAQLEAVLEAILPRAIERELWTSAEAVRGQWADQFRLKTPGVVETLTNTAVPFRRALALAEQAAADNRFTDMFGGAFIHLSLALFSLISSPAELRRTPTDRDVRTLSGCYLVPEVGATGTWTEATDDAVEARPGGSPAGDNRANGWLFVTPPVRVRLGVVEATMSSISTANNIVHIAERAFTLEASVLPGADDPPTSIAIPVDYTQEL